MIELRNVSKRYGGQLALAPTTLSVPASSTLALIGPSGCGKSTLLRLVIGLIPPDTGQISIGGDALTLENARTLRHKIGYVIQEGGLFPHLTATQNVTIMARQLGWAKETIQSRLAELSELTQLPLELLDRYPAQLSGGQRQRVGLMRALMLDPEVLLMDEPLGALDPMIRSQLQEDLKAIFRRLRRTVLLVTHDMGEAAYLGDEIALMREGEIVQRGTIRDLMNRPADPFVTAFLQAQRPLWLEEETAL
ncbi:MAG: ABC transporter ATP-binding protein [Armatimonadetes bacterium]|nr:ABC transporter ATP-binding protein [Armatimonadota bacterium]